MGPRFSFLLLPHGLADGPPLSIRALAALRRKRSAPQELMQQMTLDEKVGQLELLSRPWGDDFNGESAQWQETLQRRLFLKATLLNVYLLDAALAFLFLVVRPSSDALCS